MKLRLAALAAFTMLANAAPASAAEIKHAWWAEKGVLGPTLQNPNELLGTPSYLAPDLTPRGPVLLGFEGNTQYDNALLGRNFIPPDTMGAVGTSQYMVTTNGSYGIYDKTSGARLSLMSDVAFWAAAGQVGTNGDTRVLFNSDANRWITVAFGGNAKDLQIAVSDTDNALGTWKSVKFEGYGGLGFGATADYPTLAFDQNAVYIGTNNFAPASNGGANSFRGTTLNVIPLASLFNAGSPTVANFKQFVTPYNPNTGAGDDRGFALQGVNSYDAGSSGKIVAASLFDYDTLTYDVNNLTPTSAAGATRGNVTFIGEGAFVTAGPARQPAELVPANRRIIDSGDERISSSVYEANGLIYMVHTVNPTGDAAGDYARVRLIVLDADTNAIVDQVDIGSGAYDYYQGSIAVNQFGQLVLGFNRSGLNPEDGKIGIFAQIFATDALGHLRARTGELLLKESLTDDYHNGSLFGQPSAGRQRWGDYSQITVDPTDPTKFWLIGEFAREYNLPQFGHPGGTGGSRWSTWISELDAGAPGVVPEPSTWAMLIFGFGAIGGSLRRTRRPVTVTYA